MPAHRGSRSYSGTPAGDFKAANKFKIRSSVIGIVKSDFHPRTPAGPPRFELGRPSICGCFGRPVVALFLLFVVAGWARAEDGTVGIPWTGKPGITETVGQIMDRSKQVMPNGGGPRQLKKRALRNFSARSKSPFSPVQVAAPPEGADPQSTGTSFLGARLSDSGYIPPDSMGDVGPTQVVVFVNGRIRVFDRNGNLGALNTTPEGFFSSVSSSGISDPRVRYDRLTGRWFILAIDIPNSKKNNNVVIAVSSGPTITDTTSFTFYAFKPSALPPTNNNTFADYPTLGVDRHALYIGANIFSTAFYLGTEGYVVNKADLIGGTLTATAFRNFATGAGNGMFTPQGVDNDDPAATFGYFIGVDNIMLGRLVLRRVTDPGGTPSISGNINLTVPTTVGPMGGVPSQGGSAPLDDLDDRLFAARMHHGSLWTAHNIEVNTSGIADSAGNRNGSRWYEITNLDTAPTLRQSGTLFDPSAGSPASYFIPSCAVSGQGHMALACSVAGVNQYAEIAAAGRFADDPLGTIRAPSIVQSSSTSYNVGSPRRWGDYSVVSVDPNDDMTFWTFQEYCDATNSWGVRVIQLKAPPPATPDSALPASVTQGTTTDVTVTGLPTDGAGFFDPDASFPNHISATVDGGEVTVNDVTVNSPTELTLNLTVDPGAAPGARTITVVNPDGQSAASAVGILEIVSANTLPVINAAAISPDSPNTTDDLVAAVTSYTDADGDPVTFAYQWQEGTTDIPYTANTLSAAATFTGRSYRCVITPNDGHGDGAPFNTASVAVPLDFDSNGVNDDWEVQYFGSIGIDSSIDTDSDGLADGYEQNFGLDPTSSSSDSPFLTPLDRTTGTFTYTRLDPSLTGLVYSVWTTVDLQNWTEDTGAIQVAGEPVDNVQTVEVTLSAPKPLTGSRLFIRVDAEQP